MITTAEPAAVLSHLYRADGSATFSQSGYSVIGAVNGPIEVQRRDELPEEAAIDVNVRPAAGVGGTRERHLESIIQSTLRQVALIHNFPRTLIQVTLQITSTPENESESSKLNQASSNLPVLPALLQAAVLALISAAMPLATTIVSTLLAINLDEKTTHIIRHPTLAQIQTADSIHVFAFSADGGLLVAESDGEFNMNGWEEAFEEAKHICFGTVKETDPDSMLDESGGMSQFIRNTLQEKSQADIHWKKQ